MKIRTSNLIFDSIVDGPSLRTVLFTQGCSHHCPGCHNTETWDPTKGQLKDVDDLFNQIINHGTKAMTFSGGEPFEQPLACAFLAQRLKEQGFNLWSYSGYTWEQIQQDEDKKQLLKHLDVLVDGRFILAQKSLTLRFKGSSNQRIIDVQESIKQNKIVLYSLNKKRDFRQKREGIYI